VNTVHRAQGNRKNESDSKKTFKLAIETGGDWVTLLPFALFCARNTPYQLNLTPFKILYGRPPPVCPIFKGKKVPPPTLGQFQEALMALNKVHSCVWKLLREIHVGQNKETIPSHDIGPGDWVWVKRHQTKALKPKWKGPYVVLLTTPTALKVDGIGPWVHCNHVRPAASAEQEDAKKE
jgi:hypothetical protein